MAIYEANSADTLKEAWKRQIEGPTSILVTRPINMNGSVLPAVRAHAYPLYLLGMNPFAGIEFRVEFDGTYQSQDCIPITAASAVIDGLRIGRFEGWGSCIRLNSPEHAVISNCRLFQIGMTNGPAAEDATKIVRPHPIGGYVKESVTVVNCAFIACCQSNWLNHCVYLWESAGVRTKKIRLLNSTFDQCGDTTALLGQDVIVARNVVTNPSRHKCWSMLDRDEPPLLWSVFANRGAVYKNKASGEFRTLTYSNRQDAIDYDYNDYSAARFQFMNCDYWGETPATQTVNEWADWQKLGKDLHSQAPGPRLPL